MKKSSEQTTPIDKVSLKPSISARLRVLAFQGDQLLAKDEVFQQQAALRTKNAKHGSEPEPKQVKHGKFVAEGLPAAPRVADFKAGQNCAEGQYTRSYGSMRVALSDERPYRDSK